MTAPRRQIAKAKELHASDAAEIRQLKADVEALVGASRRSRWPTANSADSANQTRRYVPCRRSRGQCLCTSSRPVDQPPPPPANLIRDDQSVGVVAGDIDTDGCERGGEQGVLLG
jgi:hypothetical protein